MLWNRNGIFRGNRDVLLKHARQRRTERSLRALLRGRHAIVPSLRVERHHTIADAEARDILADFDYFPCGVRGRDIRHRQIR